MAAATAAQILSAIAAQLKIAESELPSYYTPHATRAVTFAIGEVRRKLYRRGFTADNVSDWDQLNELTLDLGTWKTIMLSGLYTTLDARVIDSLDRRKELDDILVFVDDLWIQPEAGQAGTTTTSGPLLDDPGSTFNYQGGESNDPDHGIRW